MRAWVWIITLVVLGACQPVSMYYRPGVTVAKANDDRLDCEVSALRDAPVATQIRQQPSFYVPPRQYCDASGNCYVRGGYWEPGRVYTVDVNAGLRRQLTDRCMAQKGYAPVSIPPCPPSVADAAPRGATTVLPALTANSCSIRNNDGTFQIVNRG